MAKYLKITVIAALLAFFGISMNAQDKKEKQASFHYKNFLVFIFVYQL